MKVSDMLVAPRNLSGAAMDLAHRMRVVMAQDVDEFELAQQIEAMNADLNRNTPDLLQEAWTILASTERTAWKAFLTLGKEHESRLRY